MSTQDIVLEPPRPGMTDSRSAPQKHAPSGFRRSRHPAGTSSVDDLVVSVQGQVSPDPSPRGYSSLGTIRRPGSRGPSTRQRETGIPRHHNFRGGLFGSGLPLTPSQKDKEGQFLVRATRQSTSTFPRARTPRRPPSRTRKNARCPRSWNWNLAPAPCGGSGACRGRWGQERRREDEEDEYEDSPFPRVEPAPMALLSQLRHALLTDRADLVSALGASSVPRPSRLDPFPPLLTSSYPGSLRRSVA